MKKFIKSNYKILVGIVLGVLVSGVGVYAASSILASNVTYTPSDSSWNVNNTATALDNLYDYYKTSKYVEQRDCVRGTVVCDDRCAGSEGLKITDFKPSYVTLYFYHTGYKSNTYVVYDEKVSNSLLYYTIVDEEPLEIVDLIIKNNTLNLNNWGVDLKNQPIDYVACK